MLMLLYVMVVIYLHHLIDIMRKYPRNNCTIIFTKYLLQSILLHSILTLLWIFYNDFYVLYFIYTDCLKI